MLDKDASFDFVAMLAARSAATCMVYVAVSQQVGVGKGYRVHDNVAVEIEKTSIAVRADRPVALLLRIGQYCFRFSQPRTFLFRQELTLQ